MSGWLYGNNRRDLFRQNIFEGQCVNMLTKQNKGFNKKGETECQKICKLLKVRKRGWEH